MRVFAVVVMLASCDAGSKVTSVPKDARVALFPKAVPDKASPPPPPSWIPAARADPVAHTFVSYDAAFRDNAYLRFPAVQQTLMTVPAKYNGHEYLVERGTHRFWIRDRPGWDGNLYGPFEIVNQ